MSHTQRNLNSKRPALVVGQVTNAVDTFEAFRSSVKSTLVVASTAYTKSNIDVSWLKVAASVYQISADIQDYIIPIIPIVTSDIPNRNLQAFTFEELSRFDWLKGHMVYQTFVGKMTSTDHVNNNPQHAKGVIFDASLQHVPKYGIWKIVLLCGFDRTKDPALVRDILVHKRTGYSMGSLVDSFECTACGKDQECRCTRGSITHGGILIYQMCKGVNFIEASSVESPADVTAVSTDLF